MKKNEPINSKEFMFTYSSFVEKEIKFIDDLYKEK